MYAHAISKRCKRYTYIISYKCLQSLLFLTIKLYILITFAVNKGQIKSYFCVKVIDHT